MIWKCQICGHRLRRPVLPTYCPRCGIGSTLSRLRARVSRDPEPAMDTGVLPESAASARRAEQEWSAEPLGPPTLPQYRRTRRAPRFPAPPDLQGTVNGHLPAKVLTLSRIGACFEHSFPLQLGSTYAVALSRGALRVVQRAEAVSCFAARVRHPQSGRQALVYCTGFQFLDSLPERLIAQLTVPAAHNPSNK